MIAREALQELIDRMPEREIPAVRGARGTSCWECVVPDDCRVLGNGASESYARILPNLSRIRPAARIGLPHAFVFTGTRPVDRKS